MVASTQQDRITVALAELAALETLAFEATPDGIGTLTLNRPEQMNSQSFKMWSEFLIAAHALRDLPLRAMILTGAGGKVFCAGFDLAEVDELTRYTPREFLRFQDTATGGVAAIRDLPFPVIAAVRGPAVGGGLALALAADIRVAASSARFCAAFVRVGFSVGDLGVSYSLTRLLGPGLAAELAYTARMVEAPEALRIGLVSKVVEGTEVLDAARDIAQAIAANSPGGVRLSKTANLRNLEIPSYEAALELENRGQTLLTCTSDMAEALAAFKEKRTATFQGR